MQKYNQIILTHVHFNFFYVNLVSEKSEYEKEITKVVSKLSNK